MSTVPHLMQALVLEESGGPLRLVEVSTPQAGPGQVLVRIAASGVNPLDDKIRAGTAAHARHPPPAILGIDLAGVVEAVGPGVTGQGEDAGVGGRAKRDPRHFTLHTVDGAYRAVTDGTARGKLVVEIDAEKLDANAREPGRS